VRDPKRVLVVDDEHDLRHFLELLMRSAGYDVDVAADGQEALDRIAARTPDLMLLDLMMPVMDGWAVLERLAGRRPPAVVVLSAAADPDRALRAGAAACVTKPFSVQALLATCGRLLG
jgi:CheY-like chemotaxis protein